ncbi:Fanconi anemia group M protein [Rhinophrynus dorsalis]
MSGKQKTLFQTWGSSLPPDTKRPKGSKPKGRKSSGASRGKNTTSLGVTQGVPVPIRQPPPPCQEEEEHGDDDDVMLIAVYEAEKSLNQIITPTSGCADLSRRLEQTRSHELPGDSHQPLDTYGPGTTVGNIHGLPGNCGKSPGSNVAHDQTVDDGHHLSLPDIQNLPGFDLSAGNVWIYPTNYPVRDYQFTMSHTALLHNTLVCLPTGLGKTFIAAVVMYNFYRWYPSGKIVFMAPTKPLVAQQMEACFRVMGIPQVHMAEMTGSTQAQNRKEMWEKSRVFFLTPQIMVNDLTRGACPAAQIKCLVIDEAHKALGNHAYCQVVREMSNYTRQFRILALTATPGSDSKSVQQVLSNLLISQIELRSEDSPDIQHYSHQRQLEKFVVPLGEELQAVQKIYLQVLEAFAGRLIQNQVLSRRDIPNLTKYQVILSREQFRRNPPSNIMGVQQGMVEGDFALCISLYHGYELLLQMGTRSLYFYLRTIMDGSKGMTRARNDLSRNGDFMDLYQQLENMFSDTSVTGGNGSLLFNTSLRCDVKKPFLYSHPKLKKLEDVVLQHFKSWTRHGGPSASTQRAEDTRIMIFSSFRDSVQEIAEMLNQHHPTVRVMTFVGHSSSGKGVKGFTQKEQLEVVKRFREGGFNTLVSTCVGEEGLDIGEVDLIICFDAQKSPIRLVQRMGRTGRKRQGRIVVILCQGREERTYNQSQNNKRSIYKAILGNSKTFHLNPQSPRMVPEGVNPRVHKMFITQGTYEPKDNVRTTSKDKRSSTVHRKSSLFSNGNDNMKNNWPMTQMEFDTWNRLYRLRESDGITDVILPKSYFEQIRDEEIRAAAVPLSTVRELSLTEWRVWQNRPFPTVHVDHSDRCNNFISIMETIELIRQEEGGCSYDREMKSYLDMDDIAICTKTARDRVSPLPGNCKAAKKFSHPMKGKVQIKSPEALLEPDEDFMSVLQSSKKISRPLSMVHGNTDLLDQVSGGEVSEVVDMETVTGADKDMMDATLLSDISEINGGSDIKTVGIGPSGPSHVLPTCPEDATAKSQSIVCPEADSGWHSFNEDTFPNLAHMFYTPQPYTYCAGFAVFADSKISTLKTILSCIKLFLSISPPSISELDCLDDFEKDTEKLFQKSSPQHIVSSECEKHQLDLSSQPLMSVCEVKGPIELRTEYNPRERVDCVVDEILLAHEDINTSQSTIFPMPETKTDLYKHVAARPSDTHFREFSSKTICTEDSAERKPEYDQQWEDMFDCDSEETDPEHFRGSQSNSPEYNNLEYVSGEDPEPEYLEDSFDLFEEDPFSDTNNYVKVNLSKENHPKEGKTSVTFNMFYPSIFLQDQEENSKDQTSLSSDMNCKHTHEDELLDYSQELFSVNFDLGFSIEDDELSENGDSPSQGPGTRIMSETPSDNIRAPSPHKRTVSGIRSNNISTPVTSVSLTSAFATEHNVSILSPLEPVKGKFSWTPEKSSCPSFVTPPTGKYNPPTDPPPSLVKCDLYSPDTPKSRERALCVPSSPSSCARDAGRSSRRHPRTKEDVGVPDRSVLTACSGSESEDEVVFRAKRKLINGNVLKSPETASSDCDFDSPVPVAKKGRKVIKSPDSSDEDKTDFQTSHSIRRDHAAPSSKRSRQDTKRLKRQTRPKTHLARQFLDDEAELSSEEAEFVSSDENVSSDPEADSSLIGFLNDDTQLSQALNDSDMHGVYLKSVRSPAAGNRYKMVPRRKPSMAVFSQIPEQDESYMEDSFCVRAEEDEPDPSQEEEVEVDLHLLQQDSFVGGRRQYCTRLRLRGAQARQSNDGRPVKKKTRIIIQDDSSEEETEPASALRTMSPPGRTKLDPHFPTRESLGDSFHQGKGSPAPSDGPARDRGQKRIHLKARVSEELDFQRNVTKHRTSEKDDIRSAEKGEETSGLNLDSRFMASPNFSFITNQMSPGPASPCVLVDSREISSGPEVISYLKTSLGVRVEVCSLGGCDYIVSNRLVVERMSQSEFANSANRSKLVERIRNLQNVFHRVCLIVEKDRVKAGETSRIFQRIRYYDTILSALISAGIQILFSSSQEETAGLLKELALLEHRKNEGITVPTEVKGHKQEALQFYLTIPNLSYITALNLCHHFHTVGQMVNSSVTEISKCGRVTAQKAEEIYRYLHYVFESHMLIQENGKQKRSL